MRMQGVERIAVIANFAIEPDRARGLVLPPFEARDAPDAPLLSLAFIEMNDLRPVGLPVWLGVRFFEILARVSSSWSGRSGGYVLRAGISHPALVLARQLYRYPFERIPGELTHQGEEVRVRVHSPDPLAMHLRTVAVEPPDRLEIEALRNGFTHTPDGRAFAVSVVHEPKTAHALIPVDIHLDEVARFCRLPSSAITFRSAALALDARHCCQQAQQV